VRCPRSFDVRVRTRNQYRAIISFPNALNACVKCEHDYYATTFLGNCNRAKFCPCCRRKKSAKPKEGIETEQGVLPLFPDLPPDQPPVEPGDGEVPEKVRRGAKKGQKVRSRDRRSKLRGMSPDKKKKGKAQA
jgi:hypothetical protein